MYSHFAGVCIYLQNLPATFVRVAGLWYKNRTMIRGPQGREWPVKLLGRQDNHRTDLSAGWSKFIQDNGLATGDTLRFEYLGGKDNVIGIEVLSRAF